MSRQQENTSKTERLIKYIQELSKLKTKPIRDVQKYPYVVWLSDILKVKEWLCDIEGVDKPWLKVKSLSKPEIPREIQEYINTPCEDIKDPQIRKTCEDYTKLLEHWQWTQKIYSTLHEIYQENFKQQEKYELMLGFGLLKWWSKKSNAFYRRHIITIKVFMDYNFRSREITIEKEDLDGKIKVETDFIMPEDLPSGFSKFTDSFYQKLRSLGFNKDLIVDYLKEFVHMLHPDGSFNDGFDPDLEAYSEIPIIKLAPALILRDRSIGAFYDFLRYLEASPYSPILCEFAEEETEHDVKDRDSSSSDEELYFPELYFPKPYNEEQKRIIYKLNSSKVVLVQGPPGTGKSHTIANLICHFLANGKKMLITSKSPRALSVLKNMLPESLRFLCVSILGEGREEIRELEASVEGILRELDNLEQTNLSQSIQEKEKQLKDIKSEEVKYKEKFIETLKTNNQDILLNSYYKGKPYRIAQLVKADKEKFAWFEDKVSEPYPFSDIDFENLLRLLRYFSKEEVLSKLKYPIPATEKLIKDTEIKEIFSQEKDISKRLEELEQNSLLLPMDVLEKVDINKLNDLLI
ncbi:MAG: AAA domain-containing protein, partial [Aquificaceae bacterium]